jgi:predicted transcriptional regulator
MDDEATGLNAVELATELTIAWLSNPNTRTSADEVPTFLGRMHDTVSSLLGTAPPVEESEPAPEYTPATTARKSLASKDHIISMIDGKPYKTLRRHLSTHGMTPAEYRERYGLRADYPMVAENYSESRRAMARQIGLGRKAGGGKAAPAADPAPAPSPRKRGKAAAAEG